MRPMSSFIENKFSVKN